MIARRRQRRIPEHLRVVVRVDVDEARATRTGRGVELDVAGQVRADRVDASGSDRHIGRERLAAGAVEHRPTFDDEFGHVGSPSIFDVARRGYYRGSPRGTVVRTVDESRSKAGDECLLRRLRTRRGIS